MKSVLEAKRMIRENLQDFNDNKQMRLMYDCIYVIYKQDILSLKPIELWRKIKLDFPKLEIKKTNFVRTIWKYKQRINEKENKTFDYTKKLQEFLEKMQFNDVQRTYIKEFIKELPEHYEVFLKCHGAKHLACIIKE